MALDIQISKEYVLHELEEAKEILLSFGWGITHPEDGVFIAKITSPVDSEKYILEGRYDNYKEYPILFDFIDPETNEKGTQHAYPCDRIRTIFHKHGPSICLEASRKAYKQLGGPHQDWEDFTQWVELARKSERGDLTHLGNLLAKIACHLRNPEIYNGRMDNPKII